VYVVSVYEWLYGFIKCTFKFYSLVNFKFYEETKRRTQNIEAYSKVLKDEENYVEPGLWNKLLIKL